MRADAPHWSRDLSRSAMKTKMRLMMVIVISIGIGFVGATLLTLIGWRIQIEGRAFQCNDWVPLATFTTDITGHRQAGDTLSPGWAWEDIERVGRVYQIVFWLLWAVVAGLVTVVWIKKRAQNQTLHAIDASAPQHER